VLLLRLPFWAFCPPLPHCFDASPKTPTTSELHQPVRSVSSPHLIAICPLRQCVKPGAAFRLPNSPPHACAAPASPGAVVAMGHLLFQWPFREISLRPVGLPTHNPHTISSLAVRCLRLLCSPWGTVGDSVRSQ